MTLNASKCHLLVSGFKDEAMCAKVGDSLLWEELSAKLETFSDKISFESHLHKVIDYFYQLTKKKVLISTEIILKTTK